MELKTSDYIHFQIGKNEFEGAKYANKALPGDIVNEFCEIIQRKKHVLVGTIEFNSKTKYGMTSKGYPIYLFIPFNKSYPPMIVGSSNKDISRNYIGVANFDSWTDSLPRATLIRLIGPCGNPEVEKEAVLLNYHPYKMPKMLDLELEKNDFIYRTNCPEQTFNIDPLGCIDIDDVLSIQENEIWITIADVAERISPGSLVDNYAAKQGQTVYLDGKIIQPMLPQELGEFRCSLFPNELKPGISLKLICGENDIIGIEWVVSCVKNRKSYDYDTFKEIGRADGINIEFIQRIAEHILNEKTDDPHKWIEAFMMKYNIEVAKFLCRQGVGILRKHAGRNEEKWKLYSQWSDVSFLANAAAEYCSADDPFPKHVGLNQIYCHATSPIRRYADLVNQRILKGILTKNIYIPKNIDISWLNLRQKDGKRYERDIFFLQNLKNSILDGIVLERSKKIKIWIHSWKRIVSWKTDLDLAPGTQIKLDYFVNQNARHWNERIVYRLRDADKDCQEQ